ncbi:hypothetical protein HZC21_03690 [Candidatus Peregrinibacteria bacterium]|nr:hypothetical protein [Candidatus Peregrinibacteria bacterium]
MQREALGDLGKIEDEKNWLMFRDDDGKVYRIRASLLDKKLPLVGTVDPHNLDLLAGLTEGWLTEEGELTDTGRIELRRRKEATDASQLMVRTRFIKTLKQRGDASKDGDVIGNPIQRVEALMNKYGYNGDWRLTRVEGGDRYELLFFKSRGQVDEGKVLSGPLKELIQKLDNYLGSVRKM